MPNDEATVGFLDDPEMLDWAERLMRAVAEKIGAVKPGEPQVLDPAAAIDGLLFAAAIIMEATNEATTPRDLRTMAKWTDKRMLQMLKHLRQHTEVTGKSAYFMFGGSQATVQ